MAGNPTSHEDVLDCTLSSFVHANGDKYSAQRDEDNSEQLEEYSGSLKLGYNI